MNSKFYDLYMNDEATIDDLDDFLQEWHQSRSSHPIEDYLGLTKKQYYMWCANPNQLKSELDRIKRGKEIT